MKLKLIFVILFAIATVYADSGRKPSSLDIHSSQEILFYAKKDLGIAADMNKIDEFQGVIEIVNEASMNFSRVDLYKFPNESGVTVSPELCESYLNKIYGNSDLRTLQKDGAIHLVKTRTVNACHFQMKDSYFHAKKPHRFVILGFINKKFVGLAWSYSDNMTEYEKEKMLRFWNSLK